ncbi:hypothetical protein KR51_00021740 [Rubidibacter lacunae KORDI 51-2]|uniref:GYF domain-containing protein n=1 Tax=Rubidibacter lacunae KORDI 51-2 TaxID=582515 RepID=U5DL38_9CHRO|nr:DUF4339 domain-containing protein [Rubidibacter lacunae]ERN41284.1 hypothetical protein KR51_00021740 [Rubidibacter lacunae KORDI 51-2]
MWHFIDEDRKVRDIESSEEMELLIESRAITSETLVWKTGMGSWLPAGETELRELLPEEDAAPHNPAAGSPPTIPTDLEDSFTSTSKNIPKQIQTLETWFTIYWICLAAGIPLCILFIGVFGVITAWVLSLVMLHEFWKTIQDGGRARTTPGKAVGFLFIPFFNFYWKFVAFWGLAKDMNQYIKSRGIRGQRIEEELVLALCILNCCSLIPYVNIITGIAYLVIWIITIRSFKIATVAILKHRMRGGLTQPA